MLVFVTETRTLTVATAVCGDDFIEAGHSFIGQIQTVAPGTIIVVFYSTPKIYYALIQYFYVRLHKWSPRHTRFKCASAKTQLHHIYDDVIWMDLDTIPVADFRNVSKLLIPHTSAWAAMCQESVPSSKFNWYRDRYAGKRVNYYRPMGLNTGIILFNTTRWRLFKKQNVFNVSDMVKFHLSDQDAFNEYFEQHRHELVELPMEYNYRGVDVSGVNATPIIWHFPGTQCAKKNTCNTLRVSAERHI